MKKSTHNIRTGGSVGATVLARKPLSKSGGPGTEPPGEQQASKSPPEAPKSSSGMECDATTKEPTALERMFEKLDELLRVMSTDGRDIPQAGDSINQATRIETGLQALIEAETRKSARSKKTPEKSYGQGMNQYMQRDRNAYYNVRFAAPTGKAINPFDIVEAIKVTTGSAPKRLVRNRDNTFTVKIESEDGEQIVSINNINGMRCAVEAHPQYNQSKGIIYIREFDLEGMQDFETGLKEQYKVVSVEPASFIKTKDNSVKALIVTFSQQEAPYSIYIPGERCDTVVYPFNNRPMMCRKCNQYGHTMKWCKVTSEVCRKCASEGHSQTQCVSQTLRCVHCQGGHCAGDRDCPKQREEEAIMSIRMQEKVSYIRAKQMMDSRCQGNTKNRKGFATHYNCVLNEIDKRRISPWLLEKSVENQIGKKPRSIRSVSKTAFIIEVETEEQSMKIAEVEQLAGHAVKMEKSKISTVKGMIYIQDYDMNNFEQYRKSLMMEFGLQEVIMATWVKTREITTTPLL